MQLSHSTLAKILAVSLPLSSGAAAQYVTTNGVNFELNGKPFTFAGTNVADADLRSASYASDAVKAAQAAGYTVLRSWAFTEQDTSTGANYAVNYQTWTGGKPTINEGALGVLDALVKAAEDADIKLILTLTNNWKDYGGMDVYVNNLVHRGAPHDAFYSDPNVGQAFQNYVSAVVSRYKTSPAIMSWEVANEARCSSEDTNPASSSCDTSLITSWTDNISAFIKGIDANHLVTTGYEGFFNRPQTANWVFEYDGASGQDFDALLRLPHIDFATMHLYLTGGAGGVENDPNWAMQFIKDHEASGVAANKPVVMEEYGISGTDPALSRQTVYDQWHQFILGSKSINGDMTWGSLPVDGEGCPASAGNPYVICPSDPDYADLVTGWAQKMNAKG